MEDQQTPQYYYDSSAHQWWIFNVAKGEWELCPESEQTGSPPDLGLEATQQQQQQEEEEAGEATGESVRPADKDKETPAATQPATETGTSSAPTPAVARPLAAADAAAATATAADAVAATAAAVAADIRSSAPLASSGREGGDNRRGVQGSLSRESSQAASGSSDESEASDSTEDALGNALERLMTTSVSRGFSGPTSAVSSSARRRGAGEEEEESSSDDESAPPTPPTEPIVRRVTRCMTLMDQGGLADCIQKAVEMRQHIIDTEKGGHVPGAEDTETKEEAWKIRARARAKTAGAEARERAKIRWRAAALEVAAQQQQQQRRPTTDAGAQRFADIVGLVAASRKKGLVSLGPGEGSPHRRASELPFFSSGAVTPMWNERRGTDVHGRIRFADATLSDPTNQPQVSGLLGSPRARRHTAFAKPFLTPNSKP